MKIRTHLKVIDWPPAPGGLDKDLESPFGFDEGGIEQLFPTLGNVVRFTASYRGNFFTYDLATKDMAFARKVAKVFSRNLGKTISELGDLEVE
jgi:hypothetical protein